MTNGGSNYDCLQGYWQETRRPIVSLAFVVPMLIVYEAGILMLGPTAMRNGADVWLRQLLDAIGFGQYFVLPVLTIAALLAWHHLTRQPWRFSASMLSGMFLECTACGVILLAVAQFQGQVMQIIGFSSPLAVALPENSFGGTRRLIGYFGAGIYEELLFRLMLLPLITCWLRSVGVSRLVSLICGCVVTSLVFSAAHYSLFASAGESFDWFSFSFRFLAGIFFAMLFVHRGFGIAAGTHTTYDIFVAVF